MKIQFGNYLKNRLGDDLEEMDQSGKMKKISLGDICCAVLDQQIGGDDRDPKDKLRRWDLIRAITQADHSLVPLEMLESDFEMLKERILKSGFSASVCGSAVSLLVPAIELHDERQADPAKVAPPAPALASRQRKTPLNES